MGDIVLVKQFFFVRLTTFCCVVADLCFLWPFQFSIKRYALVQYIKRYACFLNMSSSVQRAKCLHDAWFPIPPHDVPEVNSNDAIFDWKYADGFYMEVMVKGGVWENSVACLGAQYDVC